MAPQLIMLRVLEKRDIVGTLRRHEEHISTLHFGAREGREQRESVVSDSDMV